MSICIYDGIAHAIAGNGTAEVFGESSIRCRGFLEISMVLGVRGSSSTVVEVLVVDSMITNGSKTLAVRNMGLAIVGIEVILVAGFIIKRGSGG